MSLAQVSALSGLPPATLSRIENSKMSPTFSVLARVMIGLNVDWIELVGPTPVKPRGSLLSVAHAKDAVPAQVGGQRTAILHRVDEAHTMPMIVDIMSTSLEEVGGLIGHEGEEFCYVLDGTLNLHLQGEAVHALGKGGSALFDSRLPHAYVAGHSKGAKVLMVVTRAYGRHAPPKQDAGPQGPAPPGNALGRRMDKK